MKLLKGLDFGSYEALQQMMNDPKVNFKTVTKLDFSNSTHTDAPPAKALQLLTKLSVLNLSKNNISRFNVSGLIKGSPLLQELDLSQNNITILDDIVELGSLQHLRVLNIKENPIVKKFLRVKLIEAVIFPSKYKPYNAVKILTASYNSIPNKSKLDPKSEEEAKKFYRLLERDEEEFEIDGKFSRLCKYDHQSTLIKLSLQPCPVPRKTRFPMLTILNEEIISVQEIQSIMMTEDLSEIIIRKGIDDVNETEKVTRKDEELHQEYLLRYTKKKEKRKERQEDEMLARRDASRQEIKSEHVQTMRDLMGNYGITKNVDYQDELWKQPVDMKYKNAEFNIGITEFKTMTKEYEKHKEQEREDSEKRKKEYWKNIREKAAKKKGLVKKNDFIASSNNIKEEELPTNREIERLFRKRVLKHGKPRMKLEMKYSVEQGSSDTDVEEFCDEDEKEEWDEDEFLADEDFEGKTLVNDAQPKSKIDELTEKKKLAKQMTLLRISSLGDKSDGGRSPKNNIIIEEPGKDFVLEETTVVPKSPPHNQPENHSLILSFEPKKEPIESKRMSLTASAPRRGRRFFVVNESEPNMSLTAYGKSPERSVKARELSYKAKKEDGTKSDVEREIPSSSRVRKSGRPDGLNLVSYQNEQKESTLELLSYGTEFSSPIKGSENYNIEAQPDQNPNSGIKVPEDAKNKASKALNEIMRDTIQTNPNQGTLFQQATHKRAMDIVLPQDTKSFDQPVSSNRSLNTSYTLNRHLRVYRPYTSREKNNVSLRTSRNGLSSVRGFGTKTTEDSSLPPTKDDYQLAGQREVPKIPLVLSRGDSMEKSPLRKNGHVTWEYQRPGLSTSYSARAFKITNTSSSKSPLRQATTRPITQDFSIQPHIVRQSISPKNMRPIQIPASGSVSIVQSPTAVKYIEEGDFSPNKRQGKETRYSQTPKAGAKIRYESPNKIIIQDGTKSTISKPRGTKVEDLIPGPEDGVPEALKLRLLNNRGPLYNRLLETAKMLDETEDIIKASTELEDRVLATHLKRPKMDTVDPKILSYNQLTEFLRDYEKGKNLTFADDKDVRDLGQLVNEYGKVEESGMNKLDVEVKLRNLKMEALDLEGDELEKKYMEIERYVRYLELMENLEKYKDTQRNPGKVDKLLDIDIKKAEHNAVLATHYMKLEKYCDSEYLYGLMDPELRKVNQMGSQRVKTARADLKKSNKLEREPVKTKKKKAAPGDVKGERRLTRKVEELTDNKQENLSQYVKRINEDKNKASREYPYLRTEPVYTEDKLQWLNVTLVNKYEPKPMFKIEELMEEKKRRAQAEYLRKNPSTLTPAEKTIRHAEEFKEGAKLKKVLKAKVEKYIVDGTKELDKLLENEKTEIEARYNQKKMFGEYMDLLWKKKL